MGINHELRMFRPARNAGDSEDPGPLPDGISDSQQRGELYITLAIAAAEPLGVDAREAVRIADYEPPWRDAVLDDDELYEQFGARSYTDDELQELADFALEVATWLAEAMDERGCPRGDVGARLARQPTIDTDEQGRLVFSGWRVRAIDLVVELRALARWMDYAVANGLWAHRSR